MSGFELIGEEIGASVSVIVVDAAPGEGLRLHRHRYSEVFVVLEAEATFTLGATQRVVRAGEVVVAPPASGTASSIPGRVAYARSPGHPTNVDMSPIHNALICRDAVRPAVTSGAVCQRLRWIKRRPRLPSRL